MAKTVKDVKKTPVYFVSRIEGEKVTLPDTDIEITLMPLSTRALRYINAKGIDPETGNIDFHEVAFLTVKFGISAISNLVDHNGEKVEAEFEEVSIFGSKVKALTDEMVEGFTFNI